MQTPVLIMEPEDCDGAVLVYPGLGAQKEVQRKEMRWLAEAGLAAVCVDAPHHGERNDGLLETLDRIPDSQSHPLIISIVREAVEEIPDLVSHCVDEFSDNVGITGISLGGFIAFASVLREQRLEAAVPILASPDWTPTSGEQTPGMQSLIRQAPINFPDRFPPCALFAANARRDIHVPPEATRAFMHTLRGAYHKYPERLKYLEYPESEHCMREQDWNDLWIHVVDWFSRYLPE